MSPAPGVYGPTEERLALARRAATLRAEGLVYREIAERLGVSRSYTSELIQDPDGSRARARKDGYRGECIDCGAPTSGSDGRGKAPSRCDSCSHAKQKKERVWTREAVIEAVQHFAAERGRPPTSSEWNSSDRGDRYPPLPSVYKSSWKPDAPFDSWADAIEAAGFPRPKVGDKINKRGEGRDGMSRAYVVLERLDDGSYRRHDVEAYNEPTAIEQVAERSGQKFVAIAIASFRERTVEEQTRLTVVMDANGSGPSDARSAE